jgi:hypothetical protein
MGAKLSSEAKVIAPDVGVSVLPFLDLLSQPAKTAAMNKMPKNA